MQEPPPIIHSARLVAYADNDTEVRFTDRINLLVGSEGSMERIGEVPHLAICTPYPNHEEFLLMFCDTEWEPKGVIAFSSIEEAKNKAERGYVGISRKWRASSYSDDEIMDFLRNEYEVDPSARWWEARCSFCGRTDHETGGMFASERASICNECIEDFYAHIHEPGNA